MRLLASTLALAGALAGCDAVAEPRQQWTVHVSTDASIPQFGDLLLVDVVDEAGSLCETCRRVFGLSPSREWPIVFGVVAPADGSARYVRALLYRSALAASTVLPESAALLEVAGRLPEASATTQVALVLSMNCFGIAAPSPPDGSIARGLLCDPSTGSLGPVPVLSELDDARPLPAPGSWLQTVREDCPDGVDVEGMACVPGGAFLMGAPTTTLASGLDPQPERLVRIRPFLMDVDEVTVAEVAALAGRLTDEPEPTALDAYGQPERSDRGACLYGLTGAEAYPVNCVTHAVAEQVCHLLGKRLPTEAEWEYAAGNGPLESPYPWGAVAEPCSRARVLRGRQFLPGDPISSTEFTDCRTGEDVAGPLPQGHEADVTSSKGWPQLRNLAGNLSEWVADAFAPYDAPCWQRAGRLGGQEAPCANAAQGHSVRGGNWASELRAASARDVSTTQDPYTGLRCARSLDADAESHGDLRPDTVSRGAAPR